MSKASSLAGLTAGLIAVLSCTLGAGAAGGPTGVGVLSLKAAAGIIIRYPRDWRAAVARDGLVVALAGPAHGGVIPAATFLVARGQGNMSELLDSATSGLREQAPIRLLGERHLSPYRWARYYARGEGAIAEYVMVGVAQERGWAVTMVGVDMVSDPWLRVHAKIMQTLLAAIVFPAE
jgi:hypothetical protein